METSMTHYKGDLRRLSQRPVIGLLLLLLCRHERFIHALHHDVTAQNTLRRYVAIQLRL